MRRVMRRPELPAGPLDDLYDALYDLYRRASFPSSRALAKLARSNYNTVWQLFTKPDTPVANRRLLLAVVHAMADLALAQDHVVDDTVAEFDQLWEAVDQHEKSVAASQVAPTVAPDNRDQPASSAARRLAQVFVASAIDAGEDLQELRRVIRRDDIAAADLLAQLAIEELAERHDFPELQGWIDLGSAYAARLMAQILAEDGDLSTLREESEAGNAWASYELQMYVWTDHPHRSSEPVAPIDWRPPAPDGPGSTGELPPP